MFWDNFQVELGQISWKITLLAIAFFYWINVLYFTIKARFLPSPEGVQTPY
jgi:hypothetical protein